MPTVKALHLLARQYGVPDTSKLHKSGLIKVIAEACTPNLQERIDRALQTGQFPALQGDVQNPHKKGQHHREARQLYDEVTASLRANADNQQAKKNPFKHLPALWRI